MWGSSWSLWTGVLAIGAVILAALLTAWTPIFAIVIVLALIPIGAAAVMARRRPEDAGEGSASTWVDEHTVPGDEHEVRTGDGMVSDRERAEPQ